MLFTNIEIAITVLATYRQSDVEIYIISMYSKLFPFYQNNTQSSTTRLKIMILGSILGPTQ